MSPLIDVLILMDKGKYKFNNKKNIMIILFITFPSLKIKITIKSNKKKILNP
jgi:hypothetical protein